VISWFQNLLLFKFNLCRYAAVLAGHESNVRAQAWHPEIAHVCFTGGWDKTIRTWDVRNGCCLHVTVQHLADVYAIATHPDKPFVAAGVGTFHHVILQSKHIKFMTASMVHVTNLTPGRECNPTWR
jgi:WD40 repeat protein